MKALLLLVLLVVGGYYAYTKFYNPPEPPPPPPPPAAAQAKAAQAKAEPDRYAFAESFFFKSRVKALVGEIERRMVSSHNNVRSNTATDIRREVAILREYTIKEGKLYDNQSFETAIVRALRSLGHLPDQCDFLMKRILQEAGSGS